MLGLPNKSTRFKKFLIEPLHETLFEQQGIKPYNRENDPNANFDHVSMKIDHTYLRAPKGSIVFVRRKQGEHINLYDYELRYEKGDERI